ncbi:MAG: proton-conducting transporter membrane subunit [candidate division WOR-3 bacterium]|nr:proton-conducting transporter membrane subunit [candidate division WOR-3 bacterium]
MNEIYYVIVAPIFFGLLGFVINRLRTEFDLVAFILTLWYAIRIFIATRTQIISYNVASIIGIDFRFYADSLAGFIVLFNAIFAILIWLYSLRAMSKMPRERVYYLYVALTLSAANGVVLSGNLIFLLLFWNVLVFSLYGILQVGKVYSSPAARKAITIIGVSDYLMMLGIVIFLVRTGNLNFPLENTLRFTDVWLVVSYVMILVGVLAKLGTVPLHTWIPEASKVVPASTMAFIPGSLDKLLGFYLLMRISYNIFDITKYVPLQLTLMIIGSITIIFMALMALWQKDAQRLLAFSTVSQAGYMVLGVGTGIPIAIAGALFHMLNNVLYKSALFLSTGSVDYRAKTTDLDALGGLGVKMPYTLFTFVVAALALSGVPPLNGFYSKWMIYQGIIEMSDKINIWFIFLICAMFGSILTLAYSLKLIHSIFLGERPKELNKVREARFEMVVPALFLALGCIAFGVFAQALPLKHLVLPSLGYDISEVGFWSPTLATVLIIVGIIVGLIVYLIGTAMKPRRTRIFVGGEIMEEEAARMTGPNFYSSLNSMEMLKKTYDFGEGGAFDFYNYLRGAADGAAILSKDVIDRIITSMYKIVGRIAGMIGNLTSLLHTGELYTYVGWIFLGGIVILLILVF